MKWYKAIGVLLFTYSFIFFDGGNMLDVEKGYADAYSKKRMEAMIIVMESD